MLHWMAQAHTPDFVRELKYKLEAFNIKIQSEEEAVSDNFLWKTQQKIALTDMDRDNLWEPESLDSRRLPLVVALKEQTQQTGVIIETSKTERDRWVQKRQRVRHVREAL